MVEKVRVVVVVMMVMESNETDVKGKYQEW